jgi:hypothetical protein
MALDNLKKVYQSAMKIHHKKHQPERGDKVARLSVSFLLWLLSFCDFCDEFPTLNCAQASDNLPESLS